MGGDGLSLFFAGAIAICADPSRISGFILVLLGLYPVVLGAVKNFDIGVMAIFAAGCLVGLLSTPSSSAGCSSAGAT